MSHCQSESTMTKQPNLLQELHLTYILFSVRSAVKPLDDVRYHWYRAKRNLRVEKINNQQTCCLQWSTVPPTKLFLSHSFQVSLPLLWNIVSECTMHSPVHTVHSLQLRFVFATSWKIIHLIMYVCIATYMCVWPDCSLNEAYNKTASQNRGHVHTSAITVKPPAKCCVGPCHATRRALICRPRDFTRPLNVCWVIGHQDVRSRSFKVS